MAFYKKGLVFVLGVSIVAILLVTVILISIGNKQREVAERENKKGQEGKSEEAQIEKPPVTPTPEISTTGTTSPPAKERRPMPGYLAVAGFQKCVGMKRNTVTDSNGKSYTFKTLCLPTVEIPDGCDPQTYVTLKNLGEKDHLEDCTD